MITNTDGTRYQLESIYEILDGRFLLQDYPNVSDILGSDWAAHLPYGSIGTSEQYRELVERMAADLYPDDAGVARI